VTEERWPGEDRISTTEEDDPGVDSPEAEADGLCDRCREVLQLRAGEPAGVVQ